MIQTRLIPAGERIIEPMLALARCSKLQRIVVAGSKSGELMFELHRRGYVRVATTANCGLPAGQYDVALVDWRQRSIKALETTLDWLVDFLSSGRRRRGLGRSAGTRRQPQAPPRARRLMA